MPEVLAASGVYSHQIPVVVRRKDNSPGCRERSRPHSSGSWHRELPAELSCLRVECSKKKLAGLAGDCGVSRSTESTPRNRLLRRTVIYLALLQRHHKKQSELRIERWRPPVSGSMHRRTHIGPRRRRICIRDHDWPPPVVNAL